METRSVFFVSDGTGITAETFGNAILQQFDITFKTHCHPFVDTVDKAYQVAAQINRTFEIEKISPIVFTTLVDENILQVLKENSQGFFLDMVNTFVTPLEQKLGMKSSRKIGRFSDITKSPQYHHRIEAIDYTLVHDDGQTNTNLSQADVILVGISRTGKTPTSLYLAMQHSLKVANYPLVPEDFAKCTLPSVLIPLQKKLFGLTIDPQRLCEIRNERFANTHYASIKNCCYEIEQAESMMRLANIHYLSTTHKSIEEIATTILQTLNLKGSDQ
jgi:regulator of PEP synthase PpsR (kinase-PPPase family)